MPVLPLAITDLKPLLAMAAADTSADADLTLLLAAQQPALEYGLDPAILAASLGSAGLMATLLLGMAEALAGEYLRRQARAPGATDDFHLGPLTVSASRSDSAAQLGERLAAHGLKRLEPFGRAARQVAADASAGLPDGSSKAQALLQTNLVPTDLAALPAGTPSLFDSTFGSVFDLPFDLPFDDGGLGGVR